MDPRIPILNRRALLGAGTGLLAASVAGCTVVSSGRDAAVLRPNKDPAPGRRVTIDVYNIWGSDTGSGMVACAQAFEESQPDIAVRVIFAPAQGGGDSTVQQKLFTALAAHEPPDIGFMDAAQSTSWNRMGMLTDLTPYFEADGIALDDFFPAVARSMTSQGRIRCVTWNADANFPFFWNKQIFADAGLDPDRPPRTIEEVDSYCREINRIEGGRATRIGLIPWNQYGAANSMLTWGYAFGGSFVDEKGGVTSDDERNIAALEWMCRSARDIGGAQALSIAPPTLSLHPFAAGNLGMAGLVNQNLQQITKAAPELDIGATLLPYGPPGGTEPGQGTWLGGWSAMIPQGARHPDEAWEFIKWLAISDEGTRVQWESIGSLVGYAKAAINDEIAADPMAGIYHRALSQMKNTRPLIEASDFHHTQLQNKVDAAVYGQLSPAEALRQVRVATEAETIRFREAN